MNVKFVQAIRVHNNLLVLSSISISLNLKLMYINIHFDL